MSRTRSRTSARFRSALLTLLPLVALLGLSASCAERAQEPTAESGDDAGAFPVRLALPGGPPVTLDKRPERIVSLSPSTTETLFALGAGPQVVAVDDASDYPPQAPRSELSGINLDPEAIAGKNPDLVVVRADLNNKLTNALAKTGTKTLVLPDAENLDEAYEQFRLLGTATGHAAAGEDLAKRTKGDIDKIVADTPKPPKPLRYYHEVDPTYYSATSATFIGDIYSRFGLTNIADGPDPHVSGGYPQLSPERVLQANPDLIFLADTKCCAQNARSVAARPGLATLDAVKQGHVVGLDDDVVSRWSPRIVDAVRAVADAVRGAER